MKTYTVLYAFTSVQMTAEELLAEFDRQEKLGNHIEQITDSKVFGENCFMVCYW